jgi:hypothetical protein
VLIPKLAHFRQTKSTEDPNRLGVIGDAFQVCSVSKVITMPGQPSLPPNRLGGIRDRRYTIRFPFAADAELIDVESGKQVTGVTSDISMGGCFVCTSKGLPVNARARLRLSRKGEAIEAFVVVRIAKPRVGLGLEFIDVESPHQEVLSAWIESLRRSR